MAIEIAMYASIGVGITGKVVAVGNIITTVAFQVAQVSALDRLVFLELLSGFVQIEPLSFAAEDYVLFPVIELLVNDENVDAGPVLPVDTLFQELELKGQITTLVLLEFQSVCV